MSHTFDVLWLSASPSLKYFDQPLLRSVSSHFRVAEWEYRQHPDEASSPHKAIVMLHDYLKFHDRPVHLAGHGMGGVLALMYAQQYPARVRSLSLLAVAAQPAITWHAHYYVQRQLLMTCSREQILAQTVTRLFNAPLPFAVKELVRALRRDLEETPSLHSLFRLMRLPKAGVAMPLLVCGSQSDPIVHSPILREWLEWFKPDDRLWECPDGHHFFHYAYATEVAKQLLNFWQQNDANLPKLSAMSIEVPAQN